MVKWLALLTIGIMSFFVNPVHAASEILPARVDVEKNDHGLSAFLREDYQTALMYWIPRADAGDSIVQNNVGWMYYSGLGTQQNYVEAAKWMTRAANQGHYIAQENLGIMYAYGRGVEKSFIMSYKWVSLSIHHGNENARSALDQLSEGMTTAQIFEGRMLAQNWRITIENGE